MQSKDCSNTDTKMIIEPMSAGHITAISNLEKQCFSDPWSLNAFLSELNNPLAVYFVALLDGVVVGFIGMHHILGEGDITNLAVHPKHRGLGIAKHLIQRIIGFCFESNIHLLMLEVRRSNMAAIRLYQSFGFVQVGERPGYYANPYEDALLMNLPLS